MSIANQTHSSREHVVIDGASSDGTLSILRKHQEHIDVLVSEPDYGIYDALNKGIAKTTGDVVGFLHADDLYGNNDVLAMIVKLFESDEKLSAVYGDLDYVSKDDTGKIIRHWKSKPFTSRSLSQGWMPPHPTLYVRREWYEKIGGFDSRYKISADYYSILQLFGQNNFKTQYLPEVLVKMRWGGVSNRSLTSIAMKTLEDWDALKRSNFGFFGRFSALTAKNVGKLGQFVGN